jgi:hypothetical protein
LKWGEVGDCSHVSGQQIKKTTIGHIAIKWNNTSNWVFLADLGVWGGWVCWCCWVCWVCSGVWMLGGLNVFQIRRCHTLLNVLWCFSVLLCLCYAGHRKCSEASLNWGPENAAQRVADIVLHVCDGGRPAMAALEHVCICTSKERDGPKSAARPNQRQRGPTGTRAHGMWSSARESRLSRGLVVRPRRLLFHQRLLRLD